ncbi:hypothetical protein KSP39_PZI004055 [Platanthera zijinensis]|uniref:Uncharacterized protein n=1 Tax=Platanthera zijinensis TaxID=2320716 RepID=A0AAP0GBN0_9ASPA
MIKLQPKIYDHIMFTVHISFIPLVCSQVPIILIYLIESRREVLWEPSRAIVIFYGFSAYHSSSFHTSRYLVPNCRLFPSFFSNRFGYLCGIDCISL